MKITLLIVLSISLFRLSEREERKVYEDIRNSVQKVINNNFNSNFSKVNLTRGGGRKKIS